MKTLTTAVETRLIRSLETRLSASLLMFFLANICLGEEVPPPPPPLSISLDQATKQIIKNDTKIRVLGAETEIIDGKQVHVIKVLTLDGRIQHFKIDAETGEIIN
ncbi:MAG: PepSY domain-containing protein [Methylococcales bacterium]|nr:PepSY domain-containing protein [Methylococcales bacterium]